MLHKALIPLDFSEPVEVVKDMCRFLTNFGTEQVYFLHVGTDKGKTGKANQKRLYTYTEVAEEIGLETEISVKPGSIQIQSIKTAETEGADYISIPFRKRSWLSYVLLGSHVKDVIRQSHLPVFVYKDPKRRELADEYFRALFAVSLRGSDEDLVPYIRTNSFQADQVTFLHAGKRAPDPVVEKERNDTVERELNALREKCGLSEEEGTCIAVIGTPRKQIIKIARKLPANLVLMGKSDVGGGSEPVLGSTAEEVSYNVPCSVLIIPKKEMMQ